MLPVRSILIVVVLAATGYIGLAFWAGWSELIAAFRRIGVAALLGGALAVTSSLLFRFGRWQLLMKRIGARLPAMASLRIYVAGLALTASPGKVGETLRSAMLLRWQVPVGASLAAFLVDRLCDVVGVAVLAALTGPAPALWIAVAGAALGAGMLLHAAAIGRLPSTLQAWLASIRVLRPVGRLLASAGTALRRVWSLPRALAYSGIGALAYSVQALVFATFVTILWPEASASRAAGIYATATLTGAASMIPGGLGVMELTSIALLAGDGMPVPDATAAVVATRAVTLWFAILLGIGCLATAPLGDRR